MKDRSLAHLVRPTSGRQASQVLKKNVRSRKYSGGRLFNWIVSIYKKYLPVQITISKTLSSSESAAISRVTSSAGTPRPEDVNRPEA